jgi:hypothetical protein
LDRRKIEYISPTALSLWTENPEEFYVQRIAPIKIDKEPQTKPMAIGAGFDAFVKAYIVTDILSKGRRAAASLKLEDFNITKIFEAQVEPHNRDWAWHECQYVFDAYMASGAYGRLARILLEATEINMEFKKQATVTSNGRSVVFLGKPDLKFVYEGYKFIQDWKVNGYCSKYNVSPKPGYLCCYDGWDHAEFARSRSDGRIHKNAQPMMISGIDVDIASWFEHKDWAPQLAIYGWLCGYPVGEKFVAWVDQLCCGAASPSARPLIRVASHRAFIAPDFQIALFDRAHAMWQALTTGYYFTEMSREESDARAATLDDQYRAFDEAPDWLRQMIR